MNSPLTRREVGAGLFVALASGSAAASVPLFADIRQFSVPGDVHLLTTAGHGRAGVGGAAYRRCASATETRYRVHSADGACWQLAGSEVSPEQVGAAGDGATDDHEALMAAQAMSRPLALTPGRAYRVGATLELSVPVHGAGSIVTTPGFRGDVLIHAKPGFHLSGVTLDGAGLAAAIKTWLGVGAPSGAGIFLEGTAEAPLQQTIIEGVTLRNTPGGGLMAKFAHGIRIRGFKGERIQANAVLPSSAVVELFHCDDGEIRDCSIRGFRWKGYAIDACRRTVAYGCTAEGGNPIHAAHYIDEGEDVGYVDCSHSHGGYSAKANAALRPFFRGYRSTDSAGGVQFQSCKDFAADGVTVTDCAGAALLVAASTAGPSVGGQIVGARVSWTPSPDPGAHHAAAPDGSRRVGLLVTCNGAKNTSVTGLKVRNLTVEGAFIGVHVMPAPGIDVVEPQFDVLHIADSTQYGILAFVRSLAVTGPSAITGQGADFPAVAIYTNTGVSGGSVTIDGLKVSGKGAGGAMIEIGVEAGRSAAFSSLTFSHNLSDGGRSLLSARLSAVAPGVPVMIDLHDNRATNLTGPAGADITLAPGSGGVVSATGNRFTRADGGPATLRLSPRPAFAPAHLPSDGGDVPTP